MGTDGTTGPVVEFYWRPSCGFCARLEGALSRAGVPLARHNIWEHDDAAAFVRSVARGSETVPTVAIGGWTAVNPAPHEVIDELSRQGWAGAGAQ